MLSLSGAINTMKLALAGISIQLVLSALVQGILIANNAAEDIVFWLAGSVSAAQWSRVAVILPFPVARIAVAVLAGRHFGLLALDKIGRAACRESVLQYVYISVVALS